MELGKPEEAEPLQPAGAVDEAAAVRRRRIPRPAMGLNNLAYVLEARGKLDDAEAAYREALAINRKLLGDEPPDDRAQPEQHRLRRVREGRARSAIKTAARVARHESRASSARITPTSAVAPRASPTG